jgi:uncharacterized protein (DUF983 family)
LPAGCEAFSTGLPYGKGAKVVSQAAGFDPPPRCGVTARIMTEPPVSTLPATGEILTALRRGILLRCPRCGGGGLLRSWLRLEERCGACGLLLDRGEGDHFLGAYVLNLVLAEVVPAATVLAGVAWTWPDVPWRVLGWAAVVLAIACPFAFFPFSRTLWLALDHTFRRD